MMICRKLKEEDIPEIMELAKAFHMESDRNHLVFKNKKIEDLARYIIKNFFAVVTVNRKMFCDRILDEEIIGMMGGMLSKDFFFDEVMASDYLVYVKPDYRSQGAGKMMIQEFIKWAESKKVKHICIGVNSGITQDNTIKMYEKMGFITTGVNMMLKER